MPGDLQQVTDEDCLAQIKHKYGDISLPPEEQEWISKEGKKRWSMGDYVSSDELHAEYAERKAEGTLD